MFSVSIDHAKAIVKYVYHNVLDLNLKQHCILNL